jgi:hypothetical protein
MGTSSVNSVAAYRVKRVRDPCGDSVDRYKQHDSHIFYRVERFRLVNRSPAEDEGRTALLNRVGEDMPVESVE